MRSMWATWPLALALIATQATGIAAADPEDGGAHSPMPYAEYRAALDQFQANQPANEGEGFPTVEETVELMTLIVEHGEADQERMHTIVPEPCYAAAHEEMLAYRETALALYEDIMPMAAESETVMGMLPLFMAMEAELQARHPDAYVEESSATTGYVNEPMNILDALVTCEGTATVAILEEPTLPPVMAFPEGAIFEDSGNGSKATAPFELGTGDYRLTYRANASASYCSFGLGLKSTDESYSGSIGMNGMFVYEGPGYANETWFHVPEPGRYYLDASGDCRWSAALEAVPSELDDGTTIQLEGSGLGDSMPFGLSGGDYVVRYELTSPRSDESCSVNGRLIDPQRPFSSPGGDIGLDMAAGSSESGETYVYGVEAGRYQFDMNFAWCQFSVSEPVSWIIEIERLQ